MTMASQAAQAFIGFDLGHGETSLRRAAPAGNDTTTVEVLNNASVFPTFVAVRPDGRFLLGEDAASAERVTERYGAFKAADVSRPEVSRPTELFVAAVLECVRARGEANDKNTIIVFGHPSGWTREERDAYGKLLAGLAAPCPSTLLPESRAAFMTALAQGDVAHGHLADTILIIDVGSSTTDFTAMSHGVSEPLESGSFDGVPLGAGLIEEQLLATVLARAQEGEEVRAWLDDHAFERVRWLFDLRRLKERFYSAEDSYREQRRAVASAFDWGPDQSRSFVVRLRAEDFDAAIHAPVPALDGQSWSQRFAHDVERARRSLAREPAVVILTGGASRMSFVVEETKRLFGGDTSVKRPGEPEHAISRGLAMAGRLAFRTGAFRREVDELIRSGSVRELFVDHLPEFAGRIGALLADDATERFILPEVLEWRDGSTATLRGLTEKVTARMAAWQRSPEGQAASLRAVAEWYENVVEGLHELTAPICKRHDMPDDALTLPLPKLEQSAMRAPTDFDETFFGEARAVANAIVTAVSVLAGLVMLAIGGFFIPIILAIILFAFGRGAVDAATERLMEIEWPYGARKWVPEWLVRRQLAKKAAETEADIESGLIEALTAPPSEEAEQARERLLTALTQAVEDTLRERALQAEILIADLPVSAELVRDFVARHGARAVVNAASEAELDVNRASAAELVATLKLPAELAERAVALREQRGDFAGVPAFADALELPPHLRDRAQRLALARPSKRSPRPRQAGAVDLG
jgi:DNA uptake protein ComE-like DNA-binding protein